MPEHCAQMDETVRLVTSSDGKREYTVRVFMGDEPPTCSCTAFAIARNREGGKNHGGKGSCKHIKQVLATTCTWRDGPADSDGPPSGYERQEIPGVCPRCNGLTSTSAGDVIPERQKHQEAEMLEGLQAMAARLGATEENS